MSKLKISKKKIALILSATITLSTITGIGYFSSKKDNNGKENSIGYSTVNPFQLDEKNFVILDIGDHNSVGVHFQDTKIKYCNDNNISLGLIITSNSTTEDAIYNDVEYVKGVLAKYKVDFPVYLNIDKFMENEELNLEMKTKLIKNFLEKCSSNNIYVGVYGTDTNLCRFKNYCDITGYDAYLVKDEEEIKYTGTYNVYEDIKHNIKSEIDLAKVINNKKLNTKEALVNDGIYEFKENDNLIDISLKYGISVNELLRYNELNKEDIQVGTKLKIPMLIDRDVYDENTQYKKLEEPLIGCDMSYCQSDTPNWDILKENFDFIILKCTQGQDIDSYFEINARECNTNNIPIGVYCYNEYNLNNCVDENDFLKKQNKQVNTIIKVLNNKRIDYPVYLDIEPPSGSSIDDILSKNYVNDMLDIWNNKIATAGYIPGIYCNQSTFKILQSFVDYKLSDKFEVWIAGGNQYGDENNPKDNIQFKDVVPSHVLGNDKYNATMAQATNVAVNAGAHDGRGHLDINFCIVDYTKKIIELGDKKIDIKEFQRYDWNLILGGIGSATVILGGIIGVKKVKSRKKEKQKSYRKKR